MAAVKVANGVTGENHRGEVAAAVSVE